LTIAETWTSTRVTPKYWVSLSTLWVLTPRRYAVATTELRGLLGPASTFKEPGGKQTSLPQLGDGQLDGAGRGVPLPIPVSVAMVDALVAGLAVLGPTQGIGLGGYQGSGERLDYRRFAQWSRARVWAKLHRVVLDELGARASWTGRDARSTPSACGRQKGVTDGTESDRS
jgi:hypothetical protein